MACSPQFALLVMAALLLHPGRATAQTVDTTLKNAEPESALLAPPMIEAGRKIFHGSGTCFACHGDKLQGGPVAPALTGKSWRHINGGFDAIVERIDNGLAGTVMVSHPGGISESQVFLVAAYIYSVSHGLSKP